MEPTKMHWRQLKVNGKNLPGSLVNSLITRLITGYSWISASEPGIRSGPSLSGLIQSKPSAMVFTFAGLPIPPVERRWIGNPVAAACSKRSSTIAR